MANADADLQLLGEAERERWLQKQKRRRRQGQEDEVLAKLEKFKCVFSSKSNGSDGESARKNDENLSDWMGVRLKFTPEAGKDNMSRSDDPTTMWCMTLFWRRERRNSTKCRPGKNDENENRLANLSLDLEFSFTLGFQNKISNDKATTTVERCLTR